MDNLSGICYNDTMSDSVMSGDDSNSSGTTRSNKGGSNGNSRRKMSRWDQSEPSHSNGSLLSTMERFVQTVDDMNETILVPCRLMDMKFDHDQQLSHTNTNTTTVTSGLSTVISHGGNSSTVESKRLMQNLNGVDLFQFYSMLNSVKNDLMWGNKSQSTSVNCNNNNNNNSHNAQLSTPQPPQPEVVKGFVKGHARRPSTVSTTSSTSASDTEFSELNEDSGVEAEEEYSQHMADSFHHHLSGLQQCLRDLTLASEYVTSRYNIDLDSKI